MVSILNFLKSQKKKISHEKYNFYGLHHIACANSNGFLQLYSKVLLVKVYQWIWKQLKLNTFKWPYRGWETGFMSLSFFHNVGNALVGAETWSLAYTKILLFFSFLFFFFLFLKLNHESILKVLVHLNHS